MAKSSIVIQPTKIAFEITGITEDDAVWIRAQAWCESLNYNQVVVLWDELDKALAVEGIYKGNASTVDLARALIRTAILRNRPRVMVQLELPTEAANALRSALFGDGTPLSNALIDVLSRNGIRPNKSMEVIVDGKDSA